MGFFSKTHKRAKGIGSALTPGKGKPGVARDLASAVKGGGSKPAPAARRSPWAAIAGPSAGRPAPAMSAPSRPARAAPSMSAPSPATRAAPPMSRPSPAARAMPPMSRPSPRMGGAELTGGPSAGSRIPELMRNADGPRMAEGGKAMSKTKTKK